MPYDRINWKDLPSHETPLTAENLNKMDSAIYEIENSILIANNILNNLGVTIKNNSDGAGLVQTSGDNFFVVNAWDTGNMGSGNYYFHITGHFARHTEKPNEIIFHGHYGSWSKNHPDGTSNAGENHNFTNYRINGNPGGTINITYINEDSDKNNYKNITYSAILFY